MNISPGLAHFLADLTVIVHLLFVLFVLFGGLVLLKWRRVVWLHLPAVIWGMFIEFSGWLCPLTPLENTLRERAGLEMYSGDFVMQYIMPVLYPQDLTRGLQILFGTIVLLVNVWVYWYVFRKRAV